MKKMGKRRMRTAEQEGERETAEGYEDAEGRGE
jgi:hypothetical protein